MAQAINISGASQALITAPVRYNGFSIRETTGTTAATVVLWDSASAASGPILDEITLQGGQSAREYYADNGVEAAFGVFVQVVSGAVAGSIRVGG